MPNKTIPITENYYETALLAIKYQYLFKKCQEIHTNTSSHLILFEYSPTFFSQQTSTNYPLCYSFKKSTLSEISNPHEYIMNTINNFPYKLSNVKEYTDAYGVPYIVLFN